MRTYLAAALAATLAISAPAVTFAAQAKTAKTHKVSEKTATGTVKSIDDSSLVLTTKKGEMKFKLDAMSKHDGVTAGSNAMVHYKSEGKDMIATTVMPRAMASKTTKK
jgi:hypothetical protein